METVTTEWVDTGEKRDRKGRRIALAQQRAAAVEGYERSGLTQRAFAEREGIKYFTFAHWLRTERLRKPRLPAFAEVKVRPARVPSAVEIALPNGLVVRGADVEQLAELVARLRKC
jgi:transposase-like protein